MKTITYTCDRCRATNSEHLKEGPVTVEIFYQNVPYKGITAIAYNEHLCSNCIETLEIAVHALVDQFVRNE